MPTLETLATQRKHLLAQIAGVGPMRPGSLCSQTQSYIAKDGSQRQHGPYPLLTFKEKGKTRTVRLESAEQAELCREQIGNFRQFQDLVRELGDIGRRMADAQMAEQAEGKKKRPSASKPSAGRKRPGSSER